jgi:hypothetical protein
MPSENARFTGKKLPMCSTSLTTKRKVRFNLADNVVHPIVHRQNMSAELVAHTWYNKTDFDAMKDEMIVVLKKMSKNITVPENNDTTIRGLEFRTKQGSASRQKIKLDAVQAVMKEQSRQHDAHNIDDQLLAEVYLRHGDPCARAARNVGSADEAAISDYTTENRSILRIFKMTGSTGDLLSFRRMFAERGQSSLQLLPKSKDHPHAGTMLAPMARSLAPQAA